MAREKRPAAASFALTNSWLVAAALLLTAPGVAGQKVRVEEELEAYPTESVDLRCMFVDGVGTKLTQVSWIFEHADGQRDNIAVYHPTYGESFPNQSFRGRVIFLQKSLENPSIRISNLRMSDAGRYTCEYATYPTGNEQGTTTLIMLAKPKNSAKAVTVQAGSRSVMVASCDAVNGKPVATIKWISQGAFNVSSNVESNPDGTVTLRSQYWTVPTPADHDREVSCRVDQKTLERPWIHSVKLSVEYPPTVSIEGYDNNWYVGRLDAVLTCVSNANPPSSIAWTTPSGFLPDTVLVVDNKLMVKKVDYAVNTTFICEARNKLGVGRQNVSTIVIEALEDPASTGVVAGAVIGSLLALLLVAALVGVLLSRSRRQQRRGYPGGGDSVAAGGSNGNGAGDYGNKARLLFSGSNNGGKNGAGANNNGPVYTYREGCDATGTLTEKANDYHHHHHHHHHPSAHHHLHLHPSAHDILLSADLDEAERRKFDLDGSLEEEEEAEGVGAELEVAEEGRYERFGGGAGVGGGGGVGGGVMLAPAYHVRGGAAGDSYLDDDMESQKDGSVISRTAIYV